MEAGGGGVRRSLPAAGFPVGALAPGRYTVNLRVSTEREDIPAPSVLPAVPVERALALDVP